MKTYSFKYRSLLGVEIDVDSAKRSVAIRIIVLGGSVTINIAASAKGV